MAVAAAVCLVCLMTAATAAGQLQQRILSCFEAAKKPRRSMWHISMCDTAHACLTAATCSCNFPCTPYAQCQVNRPTTCHTSCGCLHSRSHPVTVLFCHICNTQTAPSTWAGCRVRPQHISPASLLVTTAGTLQACQQTQRPSSATGESIRIWVSQLFYACW
jgi:hypothetical protein